MVLDGPADEVMLSPKGRADLLGAAQSLLRSLGHPEAELSVSLVSDPEIEALNAAHRDKHRPTDVLSYSLFEGEHAEFRGRLLGDVVISIETAGRQADEQRVSLGDELLRLLIHGVLHLLGHDHEEEDEARRMRAMEEKLWRELHP